MRMAGLGGAVAAVEAAVAAAFVVAADVAVVVVAVAAHDPASWALVEEAAVADECCWRDRRPSAAYPPCRFHPRFAKEVFGCRRFASSALLPCHNMPGILARCMLRRLKHYDDPRWNLRQAEQRRLVLLVRELQT